MGRRSLSDPRKRVNLYIEESLLTRFTLLHFDPTRGNFEYGKLSEAVNNLLRIELDRLDLARLQATKAEAKLNNNHGENQEPENG